MKDKLEKDNSENPIKPLSEVDFQPEQAKPSLTYAEKIALHMKNTLFKPTPVEQDDSSPLYSRELGSFSSFTEYVAKLNGIEDYEEAILYSDVGDIANGKGINIEDYKEGLSERTDLYDTELTDGVYGEDRFYVEDSSKKKEKSLKDYKKEMRKLYYKAKEEAPFKDVGYRSVERFPEESPEYRSSYWLPENNPNYQDRNKETYELLQKRPHHFGLRAYEKINGLDKLKASEEIRPLEEVEDLTSEERQEISSKKNSLVSPPIQYSSYTSSNTDASMISESFPKSLIRRYEVHPDIIYLNADDELHAYEDNEEYYDYLEEESRRLTYGHFYEADEFLASVDAISKSVAKKTDKENLNLNPID